MKYLTVKDSYPLLMIDSCLDSLGGAKYCSTLDFRSRYWQIEAEDTSEKRTFVTQKATFKFFSLFSFFSSVFASHFSAFNGLVYWT